MRRPRVLKLAVFLAVVIAIAAPAFAQWATPTIDGFIAPGEYGTNNSLDNAGNTGQTWYMTWDANNLYVGIVNANLSEGAVIYVTGNPQSPPTCCSNADGNLTGFNYDGTDFTSLAVSSEVRDLRQDRLPRVPQLGRRRRLDRFAASYYGSTPTTAAIKTPARSPFPGAPSPAAVESLRPSYSLAT